MTDVILTPTNQSQYFLKHKSDVLAQSRSTQKMKDPLRKDLLLMEIEASFNENIFGNDTMSAAEKKVFDLQGLDITISRDHDDDVSSIDSQEYSQDELILCTPPPKPKSSHNFSFEKSTPITSTTPSTFTLTPKTPRNQENLDFVVSMPSFSPIPNTPKRNSKIRSMNLRGPPKTHNSSNEVSFSLHNTYFD